MLYIIIHHSGSLNTGSSQFRGINNSHRDRGFPISSMGSYVGYQYIVDGDNQVRQFRKEDEHGAHTDAWKNGIHLNRYGIGICVAGDFTKQTPTKWQVQELEILVGILQSKWGIPNDRILLHYQVKNTACPGVDWKTLILEYRKEKLRNRLDAYERALKRATSRRKQLLTIIINRIKRVLFLV